MSTDERTYAGSGVGYADLDAFKRDAMRMAAMTREYMKSVGFVEIEWSRGESAYLFKHELTSLILAFVIEGLGTKNIVAESQEIRSAHDGRTFYDYIAQCNVAMIINDLLTVGALPIVLGTHVAVEDGRHLLGNGKDLLMGTCFALNQARCTYGPGETPGLRDIIVPGTMCLGGASVGIVQHEDFLMGSHNVRAGQRIFLLASTGIHANGLTLARKIAKSLPDGYLTHVPNGGMLGDLLLTPTAIYAEFIRRCQERHAKLAYGVNITGHGWRKLMRAPQPLTYVIERAPKPQPIFDFLMKRGPVSLREMYATFNMGAGFAVYVDPEHVRAVSDVASSLGMTWYLCGHIEEGDRKVVIKEHDITFDAAELDLR
ncbi:MAG: Uncharacterized protein G01um101425_44 [Candidatus Peregrinibacteria bacterium Gr01-1014_25]|nr:MAG: Uncharacterized protein G01um101425_44 [Candidatus Peregrinibacteria bacterium Gr01-1014_25]